MTAIGVKASVRYWVRLFGYFLGLAVIGGAITAGGVYLLEEAQVLSGGNVDVGAELAGGVALTAMGSLLLLAGLFVIALNVVADGVRRGVEAARDQEGSLEATKDESTEDAETMEFPPGATASGSRDTDDETPTETEAEPPTSDGDERWKREVEAKLAEGDQQPSGGDDTATEQSTPIEAERTGDSEQIPSSEPAERSERREQAPEQPSTPIEGETAPGEDEWVSGEDVRAAERPDRTDRQPEPVANTGVDEREAPDRQQSDEQSTDPLAPDRIEPKDASEIDRDGEAQVPFEDEESSREENSSANDE